ncbi:MAG: hypothetical protein ACRC8Q_06010 [Aeromonas sp.]
MTTRQLKAADIAKKAGLPSLLFCAALIGERRTNTLTNWARSRPELYQLIIMGCAAAKAKNDEMIPAGIKAVTLALLDAGLTEADIEAAGGVIAINKTSLLPANKAVRIYDYTMAGRYYRFDGSGVTVVE